MGEKSKLLVIIAWIHEKGGLVFCPLISGESKGLGIFGKILIDVVVTFLIAW